MHFAPRLTKLIAGTVLTAFTLLVTQPLAAALHAPTPHAAPQQTPAQRHAETLTEIKDLLSPWLATLDGKKQVRALGPKFNLAVEVPRPDAQQRQAALAKLDGLRERLQGQEDQADAEFTAIGRHLKARRLPAVILERHRQAMAEYAEQRKALQQHLDALGQAQRGQNNARIDQSLAALAEFMEKAQKTRPHTPVDPAHLPFATPKAKARAPIETEQGYKQSLFNPATLYPRIHLAANGSLSGITLPSATLPTTPNAADLAETEDIQLTAALRAQAAALGNNPVQIHNWVRNTIEFIPSYGSIQGADLTLQTKRGNAIDTASLEIALLRAAGIPARYVYGTIQLPAEQVMNWVGGVSTAEAAQSLLGQGGIPNLALISGGKIVAFRLEHVWVEAWVDYVPSRGAKHRQGDSWIPLDASYKQYAYTAGLDLKTQVPLDAPGLIDQLKQGATVNEQEGWVRNLNQTALQTALTQYQTQVQTYIDSTRPDATVGEVLGAKTIIAQAPAILAGSLPYPSIATGAKLQALPENLKWRFRSQLSDAYGSPLAQLDQATASLAGKKLTISFVPASQADLDLINSYLPTPHADGSPIDPSELPASLPGYLIRLKAEIRLDGQLVSQSGGSVTMGNDLTQTAAYYNPASGQWEAGGANHPIAGEYHALALDLQGVSASQLTALKTRLEQTKAKLAWHKGARL